MISRSYKFNQEKSESTPQVSLVVVVAAVCDVGSELAAWRAMSLIT